MERKDSYKVLIHALNIIFVLILLFAPVYLAINYSYGWLWLWLTLLMLDLPKIDS
jgi:hypothetical protein